MPVEAPPAEALDLRESIETLNLAEAASTGQVVKPDGSVIKLGFDHKGDLKEGGVFDEQGRVPLHIIRPGLGRGRGRHLYEAGMLQSNADKFTGWKQYVNHLSADAKKAAGGLPRDWQDLGGRITESWWDPSVPKTDRFDAGAVVGMSKPTPMVGAIIDHDPEIAEASICASATGVKPGTHGGERCWVVEGIEPKGSVDWVTEAGAGGRIVSIMEAVTEEDAEGRLALLASMDDEEFVEYVQKERPDLLTEAVAPEDNKQTPSEEDDMPEITAEALREALASQDFRSLIAEALEAVVPTLIDEAVEEKITDLLPPLVESAVEAERDIIRATTKADADRRVQVERMRATAHSMVEAASLPTEFKTEIKSRFDLDESGEPKPALDQTDEIDDDGEVTKKAEAKVSEAVTDEIKKATTLVAAANPTRVRGQGPSVQEGEEDAAKAAEQAKSGVVKGGLLESMLQESGFEDPTKVYDLQG